MTTIAIDAMGGDHAPYAVIEAVARLSREEFGPALVIVGDAGTLKQELSKYPHEGSRITLHHAPTSIPMDCDPRAALREAPDASLPVAARLVANGTADALVTAGNTGAVVLACADAFRRLGGVSRCALGAVYPTERRRGERGDPFSLILDAGLTLEPSAQDLVSFAIMGSAYARCISRNPRPRVALLSNGTEAGKGLSSIVEAHRLLAAREDLQFIGNIEGMDIPRGTADVVVTGGFTGNIVLKMLEGIADTVGSLVRYAFDRSVRYKAGLALLAPAMAELKQATDWQEYGGAPLLGFDRLCIKAHGRSSPRAFANAIKVAHRATESQLIPSIERQLTAVVPGA
ncbi:MAG: phosphate acyltransferase PlsX [Myxococcota bacterium]